MARNRGDLSPTRTHKVPLTAMSSGARLPDLIPLPLPVFLLWRTIRFFIKRWWFTLILMAYVFMPWWFALITIFVYPTLLYLWVWWHNPNHNVVAVFRATLHYARARLGWRTACESAELNLGHKRPYLGSLKYPPKIASRNGNALTFRLNMKRVGLRVQDLEESRDYVAASLGARRTRVIRLTPGIANFTLEWENNLNQSIVANPSDQINSTQLPRIELDQDVMVELDTSILVVGESGSGKSNLTWNILNALNEHNVPHRDYVLDPKKVELAELMDGRYTKQYADNQDDFQRVIEQFHRDMLSTFSEMKRDGIRRIQLSDENPLHILIADELLLLRAAKDGIDGPLGEILSAGRAAGYIVIANSQLGQVDAISRLRDLFPQRVCMAVKSDDLVNAVLGPKAFERGARCTEITEKGVGYIYTEFAGAFQRFRPPYIDDRGIKQIAMGEVWRPKAYHFGKGLSFLKARKEKEKVSNFR
jgi:S-DNA-T family DNA segregation ATPase FtsK/SpoIIIE